MVGRGVSVANAGVAGTVTVVVVVVDFGEPHATNTDAVLKPATPNHARRDKVLFTCGS
jgi:hypothetical protein